MKIERDSSEYLIIEDDALAKFDIQKLQRLWIEFFNSPDKYSFSSKPGHLSGYFGFGSEKAVNAPYSDPKEFFHFYRNTSCPLTIHHETINLFETLKFLTLQSLPYIGTKFSVQEIPISSLESSPNLVMRIAYYPLNFGSELIAWEHRDINFITLIPMASAHGLQVLQSGKRWVSCAPKPNQALVLFGDMLEDFTDGVISATTHRVANPCTPRISFSFFANPESSFRLSSRWNAGEFLHYRMKAVGLSE